MERVTFLIEETGEQLACLLNPESLVIRRKAGVQTRESSSGQLTGPGQTDQPLLFTGGGIMEIELDLLFDVSLAGSSVSTRNVRDLTGPLWDMAENREESNYGRPPLTRFIWGKTFNVPGVVVGVAERLERFSKEGIPSRSWLRMRMVRVDQESSESDRSRSSPSPASLMETARKTPAGQGETHAVSGGIPESNLDEPGASASITTAADIKTSAFQRSGAEELLTAAQSSLSETVARLSEGLRSLPEEEDSSATQQISSAAESFGRAIKQAASGVRNGNMNTISRAVEQMFDAAGSAGAAAGSLVSDAGQKVARDVREALDTVGPAAEQLLAAGYRVAREILHESARTLGTAVTTADEMTERVSDATLELVSTAYHAGQGAGEGFRSGLETVSEALDRLRTTGDFEAIQVVADALQDVSRATDYLSSAGTDRTARTARSSVETLAVTLKNMKAAVDAVRSVTVHPLSELVQSLSERLESTVSSTDEEDPDSTYLESRLSMLQAVRRFVSSAERTTETELSDRGGEAFESLEDILETVVVSGGTDNLNKIPELLAVIGEAADELENAERAGMVDTITTTIQAYEASPASVPGKIRDPGAVRSHQGERLDQIASRNYGSPTYWRLLALYNDIDDPLRLPSGLRLRIPPSTSTAGL